MGGGGSCVDIVPVFFMGQSFRSCLVASFLPDPSSFYFPFWNVCDFTLTDIGMDLLKVYGFSPPIIDAQCSGR